MPPPRLHTTESPNHVYDEVTPEENPHMAASDGTIAAPYHPEPVGPVQPFTIAHTFSASRELLFAAWTEEDHLKGWFGPAGFTIPVCRLNLVPGGMFHYCMRATNGVEMWGKWIFREIESPSRLVFVNTFSNRHGNITRHPYVERWPLELLTVATFTEDAGKTTLELEWTPLHPSPAERRTFDSMHEAMAQGWTGTFGQLAMYLASIT
jgi:uncharacterized protein YndB with AHSA1/START domain